MNSDYPSVTLTRVFWGIFVLDLHSSEAGGTGLGEMGNPLDALGGTHGPAFHSPLLKKQSQSPIGPTRGS